MQTPREHIPAMSLNRRSFLAECIGSVSTFSSAIGGGLITTKSLAASSLATAAALTVTSGCVSQTPAHAPEKVWGRRGFSPGRFLKPRAITIDDRDRLYIVDTTGRIQVFDTEGNFLRTWKTPETQNGRPTGLGFLPNSFSSGSNDGSRILVADTHYYRMLSYALDGELQDAETIGGVAGTGPGEFAFVTDIACDQQGNRYIGEYNASDRIQKFDADGQFICQWGGTGREPGSFVRPQGLLIRDEVLWVVDSCNHRIQRFDISETPPRLIDIWGEPGSDRGQFYYPYGLAIASDGTVLVIEYKNNRLQRLTPDGKWIASWGGPGFLAGQLNQPWGLVVDSLDRVHLLDSNNHRVQRIQLPA